jgi:aspartyl-tRNA(Asn)/glutamyl-tRNA(Gln) amidotransferase subunit B
MFSSSSHQSQSTSKAYRYQPIVGLEVHVQLNRVQTKLFSDATMKFGSAPNSLCSLVDAALPGTLPTLNKACVEQAIKLGVALGGHVPDRASFVRKHYFYSDLPQGYQITQSDEPIVVGGSLALNHAGRHTQQQHEVVQDDEKQSEDIDPQDTVVRITRIQLEQDSGKNVHDIAPGCTYVDLNRAGTALLEVVTEPDMRSAQEADIFVRKLQRLVQHIGVSTGGMEEGALRCDVNVSIDRLDAVTGELLWKGDRVEIKNLNSLRGVVRSIIYEIERQTKIAEQGVDIPRETRGYDAVRNITIHQRSKEDLLDYKFMPEPDLPPVHIDRAWVEELSASLPELPDALLERYTTQLQLSEYDASVIVEDAHAVAYFEALMAHPSLGPAKAKACANWMCNELFGRLNKLGLVMRQCPLAAPDLAALVDLVESGKISGHIGKKVLDLLLLETRDHNESVLDIVTHHGWLQESNRGAIEADIESIMAPLSADVETYWELEETASSGNKSHAKKRSKLFAFFVGKVIKASGGKANPQVARELVNEYVERAKK